MSQPIQLDSPWQFGTLGLYNYNRPGKLSKFFDFLADPELPVGSVVEFGVFRGRSLLSTAHFLMVHGQDREVVGFDTFQGFPDDKSAEDLPARFESFADTTHLRMVHENSKLVEMRDGVPLDPHTASNSSGFEGTSLEFVENLAKGLDLTNVSLVPGVFEESIPTFLQDFPDVRIAAGIIDCDLYLGYKSALELFRQRLVLGGFVYLDEYFSLKFPGARSAVDEFLQSTSDFDLETWQDPEDPSWTRHGLRRLDQSEASWS